MLYERVEQIIGVGRKGSLLAGPSRPPAGGSRSVLLKSAGYIFGDMHKPKIRPGAQSPLPRKPDQSDHRGQLQAYCHLGSWPNHTGHEQAVKIRQKTG